MSAPLKIAIIPARGGSKRIPRKNIRPFAGLPMIAHAIQSAQKAAVFDKIVISTDDDEIADIARTYGADVPFRRPPELSDDFAGVVPVVAHAVRWAQEHGWAATHACLIYATVPLLQPQYLREAFDKMTAEHKSFCLSVAAFPAPIQRSIKLAPEGLEPFDPAGMKARSQDLEPAYHDAGQFCWGTADAWLQQRSVFSHETTGIVLPRHLVQDIDTEDDWAFAEILYKLLQQRGA